MVQDSEFDRSVLVKPILIMVVCAALACFTGFKLYGIMVARGDLPGAR